MKKWMISAMLVAGFSNAFAEPNEADSVKMNLNVNELVVVGQRIASQKSNLPQKIEVVNADVILRSPQKDLTNILKDQAGLDVIQYPGILSGISIRGFRPENSKLNAKTLILINGRPAGSANLGMVDLSNVERVEVLKGPASAIYGPTAMAGVVNIVTKNSLGDIHGNASFSYGSYDKTTSSVAAGGSISKHLDFDAGISMSSNPKDYKLGKGNLFRDWLGGDKVTNYYKAEGSTDTEDDKRGDGDRRSFTKNSKTNMDLRLGYNIAADWRVNAFVNHSIANDVESPGDIAYGTSPTRKDLSYTSADLSLAGKFTDNISLLVKGYYGTDISDDEVIYSKGAFVTPYLSITRNLEWAGAQAQSTVSLGNHHITFGVDYAHSLSTSERYNSEGSRVTPYNQNFALGNVGFFAQGYTSFFNGKLIGNLGLRYDINEYDLKKTDYYKGVADDETNGIFSPTVGLTYKALPWLSLKANYGKGFSYADIYELAGYSEQTYNGTVSITSGNHELKNLESQSYDLGVVLRRGGWLAELTYFHTSSKNNGVEKFLEVTPDNLHRLGVDYTTNAEGKYIYGDGSEIVDLTTYENANSGIIEGIEASVAYDFGYLASNRFMLNAYANMNAILTANEVVDEYGLGEMKHRMLNVAKNTVVYGLDYKQNRISAGFKGRFVGYRYDRNWNFYDKYVEVRYPKMMTMDVYAGFEATKRISLLGYISNVTDENYYEKRGYNLPGRVYSVKATLSF